MRAIHFTFIFSILISLAAKAQWSTNPTVNTPVCTALNKQIDPRILEDGTGGAFMVWKDYRNGLPDVFVQRIDKNGFVKWALNGVGACTEAADQSTPNICPDGAGGCILTWSDWRSGIERDLYAQRIDSSGNPLWSTNGVVVSDKPNREHNEKIVADGFGGAIVVWEQQGNNGWDEWAQRIDANGTVLWPAGGIPTSTVISNKINGRLEADGDGGAYIVWQDFRNGLDYDIYAQHFDGQGSRLWTNNGLLICNATGTQALPKIEPDELTGGFYTAWIDARLGDNDVYGQRVDGNGNFLWAMNGLSICGFNGNQSAIDILSDPNIDGLICTWKDNRNGNYDIYAQRINPIGQPQWTPTGLLVCANPNDQLNPNLAVDNMNGTIITWQDSSLVDFDIRAQRINSSGNLLWNTVGVTIGNATGPQTSVKNCTDGATGSIFVFMDKRSGVNDIYAHHIFGTGLSYSMAELGQLDKQVVTIFPNPANSMVQILMNESWAEEIFIYSLEGKIILNNTIDAVQNLSLDVNNFANGIYTMVIIGKGQKISTQFVKY